ncbi:MAG: hypothetical protein PWQ12_1643 [Clostridiales bacterium]|jgi:phenylacetate-coenzyme A ligase PaaK-like adenylate-forming protein|nr:hypothetical protein [Clostridiales bacterium]
MKKTPLENWIYDRVGLDSHDFGRLKAWQLSKLKEAVCYARENSRFYGSRLKGLPPEAIQTFEDFSALPFTSAKDIAEDSEAFLCVPQRSVSRVVTLYTSGTTGREKRIFFTDSDLERTVDFFDYGMRCLTNASDRVLILLPGPSYGTIGHLLKKALARTGTYSEIHGVLQDPEETAKAIVEQSITCLVGIPIQILYLSRLKPEVFKQIDKVLLSTDYIPEVLTRELKEKFNCRVYNHYGMTEMGYGGGVECEALDGCHMREQDLYFEIVDPVTGVVLPDGVYGEVVFTTLNREAMPLIRYRTGDIGAFSDKPCLCGTQLRTLKKILGRFENAIEVNGRMIPHRKLDEWILSFESVAHFKVSKDENRALVFDVTLFDSCQSGGDIESCVRSKIGSDVSIKFIWRQDLRRLMSKNSMDKRTVKATVEK